MSAAAVHPTQRRVSCETCRRQKSRCRRLRPDDAKCARCTLLGVSCTAGQQRKVGRPRGTATSAKVSRVAPIDGRSQPEASNKFQEPYFLHRGHSRHWSTGIFKFPSATAAPVLLTATHDALATAPPPVDQGLLTSETFNWSPDTAFSPSQADLDLGIATSGLSRPATTSPPANGIYHAPADPLEIPVSSQVAVDGIPTLDALATLSKINLDLHARLAAAGTNIAIVDLNSVLYEEGPLYMDNLTLAVFMLGTSQEFLLILTRLLGSRPTWTYGLSCTSQTSEATFPSRYGQSRCNATSVLSLSHHSAAVSSEPLAAPLALIITSIFTQLISLYELILAHLTARIERIAIDPIAPIPGLTFGGLPLAEPCTQGMLFSEAVVLMLKRIELSLGIGAVPEGAGGSLSLLSPRQLEVLSSELDRMAGFVKHAHGIARPASVRRSFEKVRSTLRHLALGQ